MMITLILKKISGYALVLTFGTIITAYAHGTNLYEHFGRQLPSLDERAVVYTTLGNEQYRGTVEQNEKLHEYLDTIVFSANPFADDPILGALSFPPSTVEGTTTSGWTDDGSIVRLNTASDSVGIGTANPSEKLTIQGGNFSVSGTAYAGGDVSTGGGDINVGTGLATTTISSSSGLLGIASTTPDKLLSVHGDVLIAGTTTVHALVATSTINVLGENATSTFSNGISLSGGCFQFTSGSCVEETVVSSVEGSDVSVNISPTTGAVKVGVATGTSITWTGGDTASSTFDRIVEIAASSTAPVMFNGLSYVAPPAYNASSTIRSHDGLGNEYWVNPDWQLLVSTTTEVNMVSATTTLSAATDLRMIIYSNGTIGTAGFISLQFNSDVGSNYGSKTTHVPNGFELERTNSSGMVLVTATTSPGVLNAEIFNTASHRKFVSASGSFNNSGANAPQVVRASGVWNNTSDQITTIVVNSRENGGDTATFTSGMIIRIYGRKD